MPRINEKFGELVPDVFIGNIKIVKSYSYCSNSATDISNKFFAILSAFL